MSSRIGRHLRGNVVAYIALFFALGGVAVAANTAPKNSVVTKSIKDGAVTPPKLGCKGNSSDDVMVKVGSACIDRYENSIWDAPKGGSQITGTIPCDANGQDCKGVIFARSVAGVTPKADITWFQAQQALANSGKRLLTNAEWQMAVTGTQDPGASPGSEDCNTTSGAPEATGERANCISDHGANDMVGNLWEWVADWVPRSTCGTGSWPAGYGDDLQCLTGAATTGTPGALVRGGDFLSGTSAGPFAVAAADGPAASDPFSGFRGAR